VLACYEKTHIFLLIYIFGKVRRMRDAITLWFGVEELVMMRHHNSRDFVGHR
jgi:hypothetical protein